MKLEEQLAKHDKVLRNIIQLMHSNPTFNSDQIEKVIILMEGGKEDAIVSDKDATDKTRKEQRWG